MTNRCPQVLASSTDFDAWACSDRSVNTL